jgi:hypothetical protein
MFFSAEMMFQLDSGKTPFVINYQEIQAKKYQKIGFQPVLRSVYLPGIGFPSLVKENN